MRPLVLTLLLALPLIGSEFKDQRDLLAARAKALIRVMENLEDRLEQCGLSLRASAIASRYLLETQMDQLDQQSTQPETEWRETAKRARYVMDQLEKELGIR